MMTWHVMTWHVMTWHVSRCDRLVAGLAMPGAGGAALSALCSRARAQDWLTARSPGLELDSPSFEPNCGQVYDAYVRHRAYPGLQPAPLAAGVLLLSEAAEARAAVLRRELPC